jgi:predicted TIM-barrel fold metal-dependent hydrolase
MHQILPKEAGVVDLQLDAMKKLDIRKALLQSVPSSLRSICNNADLREIGQQHAGKFMISQFMDPRHPFARRKIRKYAGNGAKVVKLLPCLGYYADDRRFDPFWRQMEKNGQVAMVHTGFITARHKEEEKKNNTFLSSKYGHPFYFDKICRKFPGLTVILCHMGGTTWYEEACQMVSQHEHVWGDFSGFGGMALRRILQLNVHVDWNKVFWGNDAHPKFYHTNLNIQASVLWAEKKEPLGERLLFSNARTFIGKYMEK